MPPNLLEEFRGPCPPFPHTFEEGFIRVESRPTLKGRQIGPHAPELADELLQKVVRRGGQDVPVGGFNDAPPFHQVGEAAVSRHVGPAHARLSSLGLGS